ncbi:unnamed protein product [Adineta ricciae]|uniref:Uncharacterized protein n=1 Tax=Adineta ricciae TaxID=249248 RepID=A0A814QC80_ADIRI|nr:unnamed protein product [Adineta ricciae]CAF1116709.1 unnamed protein product [Adineta ricciae]
MGGSCSHLCDSVVLPSTIAFNQIQTSSTLPSTPSPTRSIENCIVLWLFDDPSRKFDNDKEQLRRSVYGLQIFFNADTCIDYIRDVKDERVFLITSVTYQSIVNFYHLLSLEKIYIFDPSSSPDRRHSLHSNTFSNMTDLCTQVQQDINLYEHDQICWSTISNSSNEMTKADLSFVFIQIFHEIMARLKFDGNAKTIFIDFCRLHYSGRQLGLVEEFAKHYRPDTALDWLRRPCFISRILNRVKRTREIDVLYKLGFFTKQLNTQLLHLHEENKSFLQTLSVVFRGKTMLNDAFDSLLKNHSSGLLSFGNLLSTTVNKETSMEFIRLRLTLHPDRLAVLFQIHLNHLIFDEEHPYALMANHDLKNGEIYFAAASVFRIESVKQIVTNELMIWCVKLHLINTNNTQLVRILTPFRTSEQHDNPLSCLGKLLMEMGEYRRVEQFFLEILNDTSILSQPRRLVRAHNGLGANYAHQEDYTAALMHFEQALRISLTHLPSDHVDLTLIYKSIGDCCLSQKNYSRALDNYERAIKLLEANKQSSKLYMLEELQTLLHDTKTFIMMVFSDKSRTLP